MKKVLCIGDLFMDIFPSPLPIAKEKILHDGETFVSSLTFQRGGCAGNFVAVLKSIFPEDEIEFISRIGTDQNSDFLIKQMEKYGVTHQFVRDPELPCAVTFAVIFNDGERHFITYLGAIDKFSIEDLPEDIFENVNHLSYRGIWFMEPLLFRCTEFLQKAADRNIPISMDLGFDPFWNLVEERPEVEEEVNQRKEAALSALPYLTYLFGNEKEFTHLTNTDNLDDALAVLVGRGVKTILVHRGSKGAAVVTLKNDGSEDYNFIEIPAATVEVINPVGSGDTFDSIFIGQILEGLDSVQAAAWASAGAAYSLQSPASTKIDLDSVAQFIGNYPELERLTH